MADAPEDYDRIRADLEHGLHELKNAAPEYKRRENYQEGAVEELIAHPDLKILLSKYGERFKFNYASVPAAALIDRVDLSSLTTGDETIDKLLQEYLWDANELDDDADDFHLRAAYLGDFYVIAWPKPEDGDEVSSTTPIELIPKHPTTTRILYSRENSREVEFGITRWKGPKRAGQETWRLNLYYDDSVHEFEAVGTKGENPEDYKYVQAEVEIDDGPDTEARTDLEDSIEWHDYGFPIFHFRVDSKPYGTPVNLKAYGPQDSITKTVANMMAAQDYQGFPQRYALADPSAEEGDDMADDFNSNGTVDADDDETTVSTASKLRTAPGSSWLLSGVKSVGQFDPASSEHFLSVAEMGIRAMATLTRTPLREFVLEGGGNDSGEARRRDDGPITKHAGKVKGSFGQTWKALGAFALQVWNVGQGKAVIPVWQPSETATDKDGLELVGLKIANGVPPRVALLEAGYTGKQVDAWMPAGKGDEGLGQSMTPDLLVKLAGALQQLGQAKTLGTVNDATLGTLLQRYLGLVEVGEPQLPQG